MPKIAETEEAAPTLYVVVEAFITDVAGTVVAYRQGEVIHPDDPYLKLMPERFRPFEFPHPVAAKKRPVALSTPEVRS
jgi:hypothetical protein